MANITCTDTGEGLQFPYDYFIAATGLRRARPSVPQSLSKAEYLQETGKHIAALEGSRDPVVIVGGGAVGVEMAAELKITMPDLTVVLAHSRSRLLSAEPLPDEVAEKTLEVLKEQGVDVRLDHRLIGAPESEDEHGRKVYDLNFSNGNTMRASHVISAISHQVPATAYLPKESLNEEDLVKINNRYLHQSTSAS